jgi:hypothetical protein
MKFQVGEKVKAVSHSLHTPAYLNNEEGTVIDHSGSADDGGDCYVVDFENGTHYLTADSLEAITMEAQ